MEKKFIYLQNLLFLLFDKYIGKPEVIGKKVAKALVNATKMLCPQRNGFSEGDTSKIREEWFAKFKDGMMQVLSNEND